MICIEEWGQEPERASTPVEPAALDPVPTGSFAFRLGFGAPFARENGVRGVGRRLDVAVAQVAATDANLERNNRIYFTGSPALFLLSPPLLSLLSLPLFLFFFPPSPSPFFSLVVVVKSFDRWKRERRPGQALRKKFAISHLLRVHRDATDRGGAAFRAAHTALAHLKMETRSFTNHCKTGGNACTGCCSLDRPACMRSFVRSFSIFREALSLYSFFLFFFLFFFFRFSSDCSTRVSIPPPLSLEFASPLRFPLPALFNF